MRNLYVLGFLWCCSSGALGQGRDSVRIEYSVENADTIRRKIGEAFRYLTRATVEEKTLVKAGLAFPLPIVGGYNTFYGFGIVVGAEHKLSPSFSIQGQFTGRYSRNGEVYNWKVLEMPISGRYYYSIKKRMRKGLSANNFSNNYLGIQLENILYGNGSYYSTMTTGNQTVILSETITNRRFAMLNAVSLQWGIQRRLGLKGFFDVNLHVAALPLFTQWRAPEFVNPIGVNFRLGLGW